MKLQVLWLNHTTNSIDAKIGLQIAWIEVYFFSFFFDVRSAFKGRFQSILSTICDQSWLNMIVIESRTQGDHEELKILLQNCLISSQFNQKLSYKERRTSIYRKISAKNEGRLIRWRDFGEPW